MDPFWNNQVSNLIGLNGIFSGYQVIGTVNQEALIRILSDNQQEVLNKLEDHVPNFSLVVGDAQIASEWDEEEFRRRCNQIIELRVDELRTLCGLDDRQEKLFAIGSKGAIGDVVKQHVDAIASVQGEANAIANPRCLNCFPNTNFGADYVSTHMGEDDLQGF